MKIFVDPKFADVFVNCRKVQSNGEFDESTLLTEK